MININILGILKDAFMFPSKNTGRFAIYLLLSVLMTGFALGGILTYGLGILDSENYLIGGMYLIISMLIAFILTGYHINIIRSGIRLDNDVPVFKLYENFMTGFDNVVVAIFYYLIPTLIVLIISFDTNLFSNAANIVEEFVMQAVNVLIMGESADLALNALSHTISTFVNSLAITITAALILFIIFYFLQSIAEARLANTGSVREAMNIFETLKDIKRIGIGRVILIILLISIIYAIIGTILLVVFSNHLFLLLVFVIVLTPYLGLVTRRALGLLYSDIA